MWSYGPTIPAGRPGADRSERPPRPKWPSRHACSSSSGGRSQTGCRSNSWAPQPSCESARYLAAPDIFLPLPGRPDGRPPLEKPYGRPLTIDRGDAGRGPLTGACGTAVSVAP
ncbi:hypothetical protein Srufu_059260 [Streptomyces libani subsp. rufus]|nr:hypothetical protein Srufu_059260 [Streptomyces libani subsp. rufus]